MSFSDTLEYAYKVVVGNEVVKTVKEEGDDGYDSELTGDLTSDNTDEEEACQIVIGNIQYKFGLKVDLKSKMHIRCDIDSIRGCYTGRVFGSAEAVNAVQCVSTPSLYNRKAYARF